MFAASNEDTGLAIGCGVDVGDRLLTPPLKCESTFIAVVLFYFMGNDMKQRCSTTHELMKGYFAKLGHGALMAKSSNYLPWHYWKKSWMVQDPESATGPNLAIGWDATRSTDPDLTTSRDNLPLHVTVHSD